MRVYVEATDTRAFACAVDWAGWCRSGRDGAAALERLLDYQERYAEAAADVAAGAPAELRKGPRGGGRDRDTMLQHVVSAEAAYARKVGVKHKEPAYDDESAVSALRGDILVALSGSSGETGWPVRYFVRRTAWHVRDHAWEIEDRSA